jgi:hypothetical protein
MTISSGGTNYPFVDATGIPVAAEAGCDCGCTPCNCPSEVVCANCPDLTPTQFSVTVAGVTICAGCVVCTPAGASVQIDGGCTINGTYTLNQNGNCAWTGMTSCTGTVYGNTGCSGAGTPVAFALNLVRISATQFAFQITDSATAILIFDQILTVASCCSNFTMTNAITSCDCWTPLSGGTAIGVGTGGTATFTACSASCVNCPGATPAHILATFTLITMCPGCILNNPEGAVKWDTGANLNQTVCLTQDPLNPCCWIGMIDANLLIAPGIFATCGDPFTGNIPTWTVRACFDGTTWTVNQAGGELQSFTGTVASANCTDAFTVSSVLVGPCGDNTGGSNGNFAFGGTVACTPGGC